VSNSGLIKTYVAEGAIAGRRFVIFGSADRLAAQAADGAAAIIGVNERLAVIDGERIDIIKSGLAEIEYGGAVTRGDPLTADANGKAVKAEPAAGVNIHIGGWAEISGVSGDFGLINIAPARIQG
jgi:hypothetical protein